jgi:hypothetical protein
MQTMPAEASHFTDWITICFLKEDEMKRNMGKLA